MGLEVKGDGGILLNGINRVREWELSGAFSYDSSNDLVGVLFEANSRWGIGTKSEDGTLWRSRILDREFNSNTFINGMRVDAELGYGIGVWEEHGLLTPYGAAVLTDSLGDEYRIGGRLNVGKEMEFEFFGSYSLEVERTINNELKFEGKLQW